MSTNTSETLTPEDRARLRDLAAKATPGPWERGNWYHVQGSSHCECRSEYGPLVGIDPHGSFGEMHVHRYPDRPLWDEGIRARDDSTGGVDVVVETTEYGTMTPADAEFIAAADPATVTALLDALDALYAAEAAVQRVREMHYPIEGIHCTIVCAHRHCVDDMQDQCEWPCPTARAVEGVA